MRQPGPNRTAGIDHRSILPLRGSCANRLSAPAGIDHQCFSTLTPPHTSATLSQRVLAADQPTLQKNTSYHLADKRIEPPSPNRPGGEPLGRSGRTRVQNGHAEDHLRGRRRCERSMFSFQEQIMHRPGREQLKAVLYLQFVSKSKRMHQRDRSS